MPDYTPDQYMQATASNLWDNTAYKPQTINTNFNSGNGLTTTSKLSLML